MKEENPVYILIAVDVQNQMGEGKIPNKHLGELVTQTFQLKKSNLHDPCSCCVYKERLLLEVVLFFSGSLIRLLAFLTSSSSLL